MTAVLALKPNPTPKPKVIQTDKPNKTLAGADLDLTRAVHLIQQDAGETVTTAITRATRTPTELLKEKGQWGTFGAGVDTLIYVDNAMSGVKPLLKILSDNTT